MRHLLHDGDYAAAERLAREAYIDTPATDASRAAPLLDLLVKARIGNGQSADSDTVRYAETATRFTSRSARDRSTALANLATVRADRGEFSDALPLFQQALALADQADSANPNTADILDAYARVLTTLERFPEARNALQHARSIREQHADEQPIDLARTLQAIGTLEWTTGEYGASGADLSRALAMWDSHAPSHPDRAHTIASLGYVAYLTGDISRAQMMFESALDIARARLRSDHPEAAFFLRIVAGAQESRGFRAEARRNKQEALRIDRLSTALCAPERFWTLNDLAVSMQADGDYPAAEHLYREALVVAQQCSHGATSNTSTAIYNLASLAAARGDFVDARTLSQRAASMWSARLGPAHPFVARALDQVAEAATATGEYRAAAQVLTRALAIRRKSFGSDHPQIGWNLTAIADVEGRAGLTDRALQHVSDAIAIYRRQSGPAGEPDELSRALLLKGRLELRRGAADEARRDFVDAFEMRSMQYGSLHPLVAEAQATLATAEFVLGAPSGALTAAVAAEQIGRDHLRFTARYLPERQAIAYAAARPRGLDLALSIAAGNSAANPNDVADAVIRSRGVILDELAARVQATATAADPELGALNASLIATRQRFAALMLRSLQGNDPVPSATLDEARGQKEDAERALAERSAEAREEAQRAQTGLHDVRRAMPAGSALASFVRYDRTSLVNRQSGRTITTTPSYIALVAHADNEEVNVIPLGAASSLERLVEAWRSEAGGRAIAAGVAPQEAERAYRVAATALRARVWDPLADSLKGASRVFIVPDGALNLISFAALPVGNRYLLESGLTIHYLSTERDLVRTAGAEGHGLLALGGPAFDTGASASGGAALRSGCGAIGSLRFEDLPGSRAEVQDIARIWGDRNEVLMLSGRAATKAALTKSIVGRKVVHLATHGFFLGSNCDAAVPRTRGVGGIVGASPVPVDNPLLLSGLALAGVNTLSGARQSNAILNAEEIAGLNLQGTEWVVLSACDTGLGQITAGEGVFGLRRALQIAGAHTIIMSLWSVEDQSTRDWMKALYTARLTKQLDTPDAVRAASVQILEQRRKRGLSSHPFYWAAFVAAGDFR